MGEKERTGTIIGGTAGAIGGAYIGNKVGGDKGTLWGGLIGALIGGAIGNNVGKTYDRRDKELKEISKVYGVNISTDAHLIAEGKDLNAFNKALENLPVSKREKYIKDNTVHTAEIFMEFDSGSAILSNRGEKMFDDIAKAYRKDGIRSVMIVGHTDDTGSTEYNQKLSEKRAKKVAAIFIRNGYSKSNVYYQGAGDAEPINSNETEDGRSSNRRVEVSDASSLNKLIIEKKRREIDTEKIVVERKIKKIKYGNKKNISDTKLEDAMSMKVLKVIGKRYDGEALMVSGAMSKNKKGWSIGSVYGATIEKIPEFNKDYFYKSGALIRMDGKVVDMYKPSDCIDGFYKQPVYAYVGEGFISLYPVSILRNGVLPAEISPKVSVYKKYIIGSAGRVDVDVAGVSCIYYNDNKMLYRWHASEVDIKRYGIVGVDILFSRSNKEGREKALDDKCESFLYYVNQGQLHYSELPFRLKVIKKPKIHNII
jgi:outer membrane protein OmpA-like peptidoglycan-associated protein